MLEIIKRYLKTWQANASMSGQAFCKDGKLFKIVGVQNRPTIEVLYVGKLGSKKYSLVKILGKTETIY